MDPSVVKTIVWIIDLVHLIVPFGLRELDLPTVKQVMENQDNLIVWKKVAPAINYSESYPQGYLSLEQLYVSVRNTSTRRWCYNRHCFLSLGVRYLTHVALFWRIVSLGSLVLLTRRNNRLGMPSRLFC